MISRFYGINLNQNVVLQQIGFAGTTGSSWTRLFKIGVGNLIITALGFVPGKHTYNPLDNMPAKCNTSTVQDTGPPS